jgi:transcriptional regulator with XRE-family HTH domain
MAADHPRTRLEQKLQAARLTQREVLRRFPDEAVRLGEAGVAVSQSQLKRWLSGEAAIPRAAACRVLEGWLGESVERLFGPPDELANPPGGGDAVAEAGRRSVGHALDVSSAVDPSALEHLHAGARRAARAYLSTPPLELLTDLVQLRDTVYLQLDRTHKPCQQAELYLLAGQVCGLLSSVSFDLGRPDVAEEQARAAHTYGSLIDHPSLCAWAQVLLANMCLWTERPKQTILLASDALDKAPPGTARARLYSVRSRALAMLGARAEVTADLGDAADELDRAGQDDLMDGVGGEIGFGRARHALCAAAAQVALGDAHRAELEASAALALFTAAAPHERWHVGEMACRADLARARALAGSVDGVVDALGPVLDLPAEHRTEAVVLRLAGIDRVLQLRRFRGSPRVGQLRDTIQSFATTSLRQLAAGQAATQRR